MPPRLAASTPTGGVATQTPTAPPGDLAGDSALPASIDAHTGVPVLDGDGDGELRAERDAPVGGQAVLEGVMMRGVSNWAVAVRKPPIEQPASEERAAEEPALGEIEVSVFPLVSALKRHRALR